MADTTTLDAFALAGRQDDAEILSLFRRWRDAWTHSEGLTDDDELEDAVSAADEIARAIYDAPATGATGFAVKAFMVAFDLYMNSAFGLFAVADKLDRYDCFGKLCLEAHSMRGLLADAARTVPELAPLVANIVNLPLARQIRGRA